MKKLCRRLTIPLVGLFLVGLFGALPVYAQAEPKESCRLVDDIETSIRVNGTPILDVSKINQNAVVAADQSNVTGTYMNQEVPPRTITFFSSIQKEAIAAKWALICLVNTVNVVTNWIFIALLIVAGALIAIAGFMWMTAGGNAEKQKKAGMMILAAVIGFVIAILARVIPAIVTGIIM